MILLVDNYDSFVFNIEQYIRELSDEEILCVRNDKISIDEIKRLNPSKIVLSPGPKHPKDSGVCLEIIRANLGIPVLGVCLGHQAIGYENGAKILTSSEPKHGKTSRIKTDSNSVLFKGLPSEFSVMRYHSLYVDESSLSKDFKITAKSLDDDVIMAFEDEKNQIFGIQFHPESYFTEYGKKIIENFIKLNNISKQPETSQKSLAPFLIKLQDGFALDDSDFSCICEMIANKEFDECQLGALLVLISEKSLYPDSLSAFVKNILKYSTTYVDNSAMIDIVGTGGDCFKSINVSTTCAFILAALGIKVAKHGNKAVTSKSGSSDVLTSLQIGVSNNLNTQRKLLASSNLAFFHAPYFHKLVGEVREVRSRLGIRTVFNILGPLLNPNTAIKYQLVGTYHAPVLELMAQTLLLLGRKHALVVRGDDGMDEISICDDTKIYEVKNGAVSHFSITPEQFGFKRALHKDIEGGTAEENAQILKATLRGEMSGAKLDIVLLNAMFACYTADFVSDPKDALPIIQEAIASKKVWEFYEKYQKASNN